MRRGKKVIEAHRHEGDYICTVNKLYNCTRTPVALGYTP